MTPAPAVPQHDKSIVLMHPGTIPDEYPYVPFESMFLARFLEENGYAVDIIDQRVEPDWESRFATVAKDALFVGLTAISGPQIGHALTAAARIREMAPDMPIVWGGWHVTFVPESAIDNPLVDFIVAGIGELKILNLCRYLESGDESELEIDGILHKNGQRTYTPNREKFVDLPEFPAYHLIDLEKYRSPKQIAGVISSRGCPFRCGFCTIAQISFLTRPIEWVVDEVEFLIREKGFEEIMFADGLFFAQRSRVLRFLDVCEERDLKFRWKGSIRPDTLKRWKRDDLERMVASGLYFVNTGVESGSDVMLDRITKDCGVEDILHTARVTGEVGIGLTMSFLSGLPDETVEDLHATASVIERIRQVNPKARLLNPFYQPIPGAPTYDRMIELGWTPPTTLEEWSETVDYNMDIDEITPFPWMTPGEFDTYVASYKNSVLNEARMVGVFTKQ